MAIAEGDAAFTPAERAEMERIRAELGKRFCRRCQYCLPCPEGVPVTPLMIMPTSWKRLPSDTFFAWFAISAMKRKRKAPE